MYINLPYYDKPKSFHRVPKMFTSEECKTIISFANGREPLKGGIHNNEGKVTKDSKIRSVDVYPIYDTEDMRWLYEIIYETVLTYNNNYFCFDILGIFHDLQLLKYNKGDLYDYHFDLAEGEYSNRKLGVTILLSNDFEGGELIINTGQPHTIELGLGDMVLFPSYVLHKIKPITKGERWALVTWIQGIEPFK